MIKFLIIRYSKCYFKGEEKIGKTKFFNSNIDKILKILQTNENIGLILKYRCAEANAIESMRTSLTAFIQFCLPFKKVQVASYQVKLTNLAHLNDRALNELCKPAKPEYIHANPNCSSPPNITCFEPVSIEDLTLIERINKIDRLKSVMFNAYFEESCDSDAIELRHMIDRVLPNALNKWSDLGARVESGNIRLAEIDEHLKGHFDQNAFTLVEEFKYICQKNFSDQKKLTQRMNQIQLFTKFKSSLQAIDLLNQIRTKYELKGKLGIN